MKYDPAKHHRHSIRLREYDYSRTGAYFITVCTRDRECVFGDVVAGKMRVNSIGDKVQAVWNDLPSRFSGLELDVFVVMPNHVHGIIVLVGAGLALPGQAGAASYAPTLGDAMRVFKSLSAVHVNGLLKRTGPLWQRNYYEHVIRNEKELSLIREYIVNNPLQWELDRENPVNFETSVTQKDEPWRL